MDSRVAAAVVVLDGAGAAEGRERDEWRGERLEDPLKDQLDFGNWRHARGDLFFLCTVCCFIVGEHSRDSSHGWGSELRFLGGPRDLLPSWFLVRRIAFSTGCHLQSGCDERSAQGRRARQPLWFLCGPASAVAASTPELVSHRPRPESPGPSHRSLEPPPPPSPTL